MISLYKYVRSLQMIPSSILVVVVHRNLMFKHVPETTTIMIVKYIQEDKMKYCYSDLDNGEKMTISNTLHR